MAITALYENTATISTTEWSLPNNATYDAGSVKTDDGVFQVWLDLNNLAAGDQFQLRLYEKIISGGTVRKCQEWLLAGGQGAPGSPSPSFILMHGWDFTLQRIAGSDRSISWSIRQVA